MAELIIMKDVSEQFLKDYFSGKIKKPEEPITSETTKKPETQAVQTEALLHVSQSDIEQAVHVSPAST